MKLSDIPQISAPLPWHEREWTQLNDQLVDGRLPHALLLVGIHSIGKSQLALALSRRLLCAQPAGSLNCGHCHACQLSASGGHGDFRWLEPEEKSRVIKIEQIREVVRFANKTAGFGLRKVIVFAPADSMNVSAFNALLKSLEEPAKDTFLILVCNRMYRVPATIRSRCQIVRLATPDTENCLDWLDKTTGNSDQSRQMLSLVDGLPLLAEALYRCGGAQELAERRCGLLALLSGDITVPQACALWNDVDLTTFLEYLAGELQRLLRSLPQPRLSAKQGQVLFGFLDEVASLQQAATGGSNPSRQLMVDALLSKFHRELGANLLGDKILASNVEGVTYE